MKFVSELLLTAVMCSVAGRMMAFTDGGNDPAFGSFVASLINNIHQQVAEQSDNAIQFAILVLLTQKQIDQWETTLWPSINFPGHDTTNYSLIPPDPALYGNYLATSPDFQCQPESTCNAQLLDHVRELYNAFTKDGDMVAAMVLYTHFLPCEGCMQAIQNTLSHYPGVHRIVVFESSERASFANLAYAENVLAKSNIELYRYCDGASSSKLKRDKTDECAVILSFQGFLIDCLGYSTAASFTSADEAVSDLVNRVMDHCKNQLSNLVACSWDALDDLIGSAKGLAERTIFINEYTQCVKQATKHSLDLPFVAKPNSLGTPIRSPLDLQEYTPKSYNCEDKRLTGVFCSYTKLKYRTAGNTMCREDSPCGNRGYSYSWCYTDYSNHWEYCCVGPCDYQDLSHKWCNVGSTWEYCGGYPSGDESKDVKQRPCVQNYPCGKHGVYPRNYWCYVDADKNWDYCCSPESKCDFHGESYKWCYTADGEYFWAYCA